MSTSIDIHYPALDAAAAAPMLAQVRQWSLVNSGSRNLDGLAVMAGLLADAFAALPGEVVLRDAAPGEAVDAAGNVQPLDYGRNLHVRVRPDAPVQLLLTGHMDTVYPPDHPFQTLTDIDGGAVLNGPGVADMKGGIALMLAALAALEASPLGARIGYEVVINSDEEIASPGSAALIAEAARGKLAALTYEPSSLPDGTLAGARPGSGNFSIIVTGRSAHAGRNPEDGRNAIVAASDLALRLSRARRAGLAINPARIDGGGPNNVVPDRAILRVNLRPALPEDEAVARRLIDDLVKAIAAEHDVAIHVHGGFGRPPKPIDEKAARLFALVEESAALLGRPITHKASGGVCDGNNIAACGVPVVDTMGARGGAIHSPDEYLIVESLPERAQLSTLVMLRLAERGSL
ncbi:hydrolase [Sphingomonas histidinilytica]|jgi:glutamate carboxypeptidase|uniref:Glutamate carboxypeptidase n=1 Tax=Rhizorhabdus histidinilytica TaxID=439228 RepID=A0A1T5F4J6_9SPHN|nr:hydrolase [Rhizorhabdus histidinilytica]MBO9377188.1 hydrolase [Rhizorhabdus histidinilytica]QEH78039.1 hydrolase [Sphingomonas sp. C8-2]SKB90938.1 glutamate carboxypeptidase [Rhizorhabdus histidinilytica]